MNAMLSRQLQDLLDQGVTEEDPRVGSIEKMLAQQGGYPTQQPQGMPQMQNDPTARGDNPIQFPGMKTEDDFRKQYGMPSGPPVARDDPGLQGMEPTPEMRREHDEAGQMSDEDLLSQVQKGMNQPSITGDKAKDYQSLQAIKDPKERQEWQETLDDFYQDEGMDDRPIAKGARPDFPPTVEEFKKKFGREPATDSEVEFYYGPDDGSDAEPDMDADDRRR